LIGGILLTDTEIRKAKTKEVAHRMTDGRGLYLSVTPAGGSDGAGNTAFKALRS
jgi:hypothetical protein